MLNAQLVAFLENKPADETYIYQDSACCAAAQFNASIGREYPACNAVRDRDSKVTFDGKLEALAFERPRTFGAMLQRARKEFADA